MAALREEAIAMLKRYLRDAPLARKIQLGFGAIIAGVGAAGGYLALQVSTADDMVTDYRAIARPNNEVGDAEGHYTEMTVAAHDLAQGDGGSRGILRDALQNATENITAALDHVPEGEIKALVSRVPGLLTQYADLAERTADDPSLIP